MTPAEYEALLKEMTERKIANEKEDSDLEGKIRGLQDEMKSGRKDLEQKVAEMKERRFEGLKRERELLCQDIKNRTNFAGNILAIYTEAERGGLRGARWAEYMLGRCGCVHP